MEDIHVLQERLGWSILDKYFERRGSESSLCRHQIDSFNEYLDHYLPLIFSQYNPVTIYNDFDKEKNKYRTKVMVGFSDVRFSPPILYENNGVSKPMTPMDARLRNLSYVGCLFVDLSFKVVNYSGDNLEHEERQEKHIANVNVGKIPVMVMSNLCILQRTKDQRRPVMFQESVVEEGGYFIIKGSEKVIISQERQAENKVMCFRPTKTTKFSHHVEIKSTCQDKLLPSKGLTMKITSKPNLIGNLIYISCSQFRVDIPVVILFRAMGMTSDRQLTKLVFHSLDHAVGFFHLLRASFDQASAYRTQEDAISYLSKHLVILGHPRDIRLTDEMRIQFTKDTLANDILPHLGKSFLKKSFFLGSMLRKLILFFLGFIDEDDRDSYTRKRVDTPGLLMANLTRQYVTRMIKEMRNAMSKEMNDGNWRFTKSVNDLANATNIHKLVRSTTIEGGLKHCLSTGKWGFKNYNAKVGVAQVLNRMSHSASLSHRRRINTPIDKTCKLVQPRKLHSTSWCFICPSETPEGQSIGGVKNMSMSCEITCYHDPHSILTLLTSYATSLSQPSSLPSTFAFFPQEETEASTLDAWFSWISVFVNGDLIAFTNDPTSLLHVLRQQRRCGILHPHTSVAFVVEKKEIFIQTDAGRVIRPLLTVEDGQLSVLSNDRNCLFDRLMRKDQSSVISWFSLLHEEKVVEYLDALESDTMLICSSVSEFLAMSLSDRSVYSHVEIHPSLLLGAVTATIPFCNHNQSPRNTYQSAMAKQSMGTFVDNYETRMDTMCHVLDAHMIPIATTNMTPYLHQDLFPSGINAIVAIMCYSGYNQEDSLLLNQSALDRGLFSSMFYRTYKDAEKRNQMSGREETFFRPHVENTRGMKPGSYQHLDVQTGFATLESEVKGGDIVIGKVTPVRNTLSDTEKRKGGSVGHGTQDNVSSAKRFHDQSTCLRQNEHGRVDKVFCGRDGDGYRVAKVRVRTYRQPIIGDKFSSRHGQKGTVGMTFSEEDFPFTESGIRPDIIMNPHAIPSRMTIGQMVETITGKIACHLGRYADSTPYTSLSTDEIGDLLEKNGFNRHGEEVMYNGFTGEKLKCRIFIGPTFYQRLKHMVEDKVHSRSTGPRMALTRQPSDGRARDGGLRFGEMERDCIISHGTSLFLKERMHDMSDAYQMSVSKTSGLTVAVNRSKGIANMLGDDNEKNKLQYADISLPYCMKLLLQELGSMGIAGRIKT